MCQRNASGGKLVSLLTALVVSSWFLFDCSSCVLSCRKDYCCHVLLISNERRLLPDVWYF